MEILFRFIILCLLYFCFLIKLSSLIFLCLYFSYIFSLSFFKNYISLVGEQNTMID